MDTPHVNWRKSGRSTDQGHCVEVGAWRKSGQQGNCAEISPWLTSSHSMGNGGERVELRADEALVLARDSKDRDGPVLGFGTEAWATFLNTVKSGRLDLR